MDLIWNIVGTVAGVTGAILVAYFTARFTAQNEQKRLREELKLEHSIEAVLHRLLESARHDMRSFERIKGHLKGMKDDDAIRQSLLRAGAVSFVGKERDENGKETGEEVELWGLLSRNLDKVK